VREFLAWDESHRVPSITAVQPVHVASYIEELTRERSAPTPSSGLAAIRHLFDWLVVGQVMPINLASPVRGPTHVVKRGKTPVLSSEEAPRMLDTIDATTHAGLRDCALISLMVFSFARKMPCHHNLEIYLHAYLDGGGIAADPKGPLFRCFAPSGGRPSGSPPRRYPRPTPTP
jgi:site-specific recombinase XerC